MKKAILLLVASVSLSAFAVDSGSALFITGQAAPGIENSTIYDAAEDGSGNTYVTGTLIAEGYNEIFVAKYGPGEALQWVKPTSGGGHYGNKGYAIAIDATGNAYITGTFSGTVAFGDQRLTAPGIANMFVARFDAAGNLGWIRQGNGNGYEWQVSANDIAVSREGEVIVSGQVFTRADFGRLQLSGTGTYSATYTDEGELLHAEMEY